PYDVEWQAGIDRIGDFAADQPGGMNDRVAFVFLHRFDQRRQITHVALHDANVGAAELVREKIFARRKIIEHHVLAPFNGVLRVGSADQSQAGYQCGSHMYPFRFELAPTYFKVGEMSRVLWQRLWIEDNGFKIPRNTRA